MTTTGHPGAGSRNAEPDTSVAAPGAPRDGGPPPRGLPSPARRGATVIPEDVVARIARRAAREAVARHAAAPGAAAKPPRATAHVHRGAARLDVTADLPYPVDIARTGEEIRQYVRDRVGHLTGLRIDHVGFTAGRLVPDGTGGRVH